MLDELARQAKTLERAHPGHPEPQRRARRPGAPPHRYSSKPPIRSLRPFPIGLARPAFAAAGDRLVQHPAGEIGARAPGRARPSLPQSHPLQRTADGGPDRCPASPGARFARKTAARARGPGRYGAQRGGPMPNATRIGWLRSDRRQHDGAGRCGPHQQGRAEPRWQCLEVHLQGAFSQHHGRCENLPGHPSTFSSATTGPASTWPTPTSCSAPSTPAQFGRVPGKRIGLATVQRTWSRHGGRWAQAGVGKGATFFFTLGH